ncbi:MAG TPA: deoxyribose-phosphate aldolase [Soehngenia sp.]|nr:deoxyribose-phosphate aldolase [Soehngenia sp.]
MELNKYIDHTLLKPEATSDDIIKLCEEAKQYEFKAVCVNPCYVSLCKEHLSNSDVKIATVIGFPLGANTIETKVYETENALANGAEEIDMVINIGKLKSKEFDYVYNEIKEVVNKANEKKAIVKVIIETCLLTDDEKIKACELAKKANAKFVKTSTGFSSGGATVEDVRLMKNVVGNDLEVKASGGIRDSETFKKMIEAGATRIGTSSGVKIINELK